ncbi:MAG TPA: hypothetical protein VL572_07130 [Pyrinomonadaceae bacterium]|nr:hypothetical protein [Pyrinomonadaceae bacterium]
MKEKKMIDIAEGYGLTVETAVVPGHEKAFRLYKGAKQVFIGTEEAAVEFLATYKEKRPDPYEGSMYGYQE